MDRVLKIPWREGGGNIVLEERDGSVRVSSDSSDGVPRTQTLRFRTLQGEAEALLLVRQESGRIVLRDSAGRVLRDKDSFILTEKQDD